MTREELLAHMYLLSWTTIARGRDRIRFARPHLSVYVYDVRDGCEVYVYGPAADHESYYRGAMPFAETLELVQQALEKESQEDP